jgi:hypothetical protein
MNSSSEAFDILKKWQEENTSIEFLRPGRDFGSGASDQFASDLIAILANLGSNTATAVHFPRIRSIGKLRWTEHLRQSYCVLSIQGSKLNSAMEHACYS